MAETVEKKGPTVLTSEEVAELKARPVSQAYRDYTEDQLVVRIGIAKKYCQYLLEADKAMEDRFRKIYEAYPMWGFYKTTSLLERVCGVCIGEKDEWRLHTATCHVFWTNRTVGGTPAKDVVRVERWTAEDKEFMLMNNAPGIFLDPLGFLIVLDEAAE